VRPFFNCKIENSAVSDSEKVHLDFESRSPVPFGRAKGAVTAYQYAHHPQTDIWCMSWAIGDSDVELWDPWNEEEFPDDLVYALRNKFIFGAHNAGFEWCIWNFILVPRFGLKKLPFEQMDCTAVRAAVMALPRDLAGASQALGLTVSKDDAGKKLMMKMAKPRKARKGEDPSILHWWDAPDLRQHLGSYCKQDTVVERELDRFVKPLSEQERRLWILDHRTNMRGVQIDLELANRSQAIMNVVADRYRREMVEITGGECSGPTDLNGLKNWLGARDIAVGSLDKTAVIHLLEEHKDDEQACRLLELRQEAGKSSVAKLVRFQQLTYIDGRMRENFMHHGANTGRAAGKGAQLQNLPSRGGLKWQEVLKLIDLILGTDDPSWAADLIELFHGPVPVAISSCLRAHITAAKFKRLFCADYSNIEGRVAAWLGNEAWKIAAFILYDTFLLDEDGNKIPDPKEPGEFLRAGPDLYKVTAAQILGLTPEQITKVQRNIMGKVPELALGFGGGVGAFISMGANYNVHMADYWEIIKDAIDEEFVRQANKNWNSFGQMSGTQQDEWLASETVKLAWRERHPGIQQCWYDAEKCAIDALKSPGKWFKFADGRCALGAQRINGVMFLVSRLPNGRRIYRARASLKREKKFGKMKDVVHFWGVDSETKRFIPMTTYGGDIFQSFVQGIARDIMMNGWENAEEGGFGVVLQVHDELGAEGDEDADLDDFVGRLIDLPDWAEGCPVSAAGYTALRYRKD
jgi:DNA polymerase